MNVFENGLGGSGPGPVPADPYLIQRRNEVIDKAAPPHPRRRYFIITRMAILARITHPRALYLLPSTETLSFY